MKVILYLLITLLLAKSNRCAANKLSIEEALFALVTQVEEGFLSKEEKKSISFSRKEILHQALYNRHQDVDELFNSYDNTEAKPVVKTKNGLLIGEANDDSYAFHSVPYAKPPTGLRRFMPPEPADVFNELDVSVPDYRTCWQSLSCEPNCEPIEGNLTEDCLLLTINVPKHVNLSNPEMPPDDLLPVMVWIHGGFYLFGSGTSYKADARKLSKDENVIVVRISYRLGPLGFISFQDGDHFIEGNQGHMDQQLAMKWVKENIEKFGGDPHKITIFGHSAGAQSVMFHLLSSVSKPFFNRAIMQSNAGVFSYQTPQEFNSTTTQLLLEVLGCDEGPSCLRTKHPKDLIDSRGQLLLKSLASGDLFGAIEPFRLVIDDKEFIAQPLTLFRCGRWHKEKEIIIGTAQEEMAYIHALFEFLGIKMRRRTFENINNAILGEKNGKIMIDFYGGDDQEDLADNFSEEITDLFFVCPSRTLARYAASAQKNVYLYNLAYPVSNEVCLGTENFEEVCGYAFHSSEPVLIFKSDHAYGFNFSSEDIAISNMLGSYWKGFALAGNPSEGKISNYTKWPIYSNNSITPWENIVIEYPQSYLAANYKEIICDLWDETNFYIKNESLPIIPTSTSADIITSATTNDMETTIGDEELTTTGGAVCIRCWSLTTLCLMFSGWLFLFKLS